MNYVKLMAEREGFEPSIELPLYWFSRPALSTTQTPLLVSIYYRSKPHKTILIQFKKNLSLIFLVGYFFTLLREWGPSSFGHPTFFKVSLGSLKTSID
jgi:hypothetical protein